MQIKRKKLTKYLQHSARSRVKYGSHKAVRVMPVVKVGMV